MVPWQMGLKVLKEERQRSFWVWWVCVKSRFVLIEFGRDKGLFAFAKWQVNELKIGAEYSGVCN